MDTLKYNETEDYMKLFLVKEIIQPEYYSLYKKTSIKIIKDFNITPTIFLSEFNKALKKVENDYAENEDVQNTIPILKLLLYPINNINNNKLKMYSDYNIDIKYFNDIIDNNLNSINKHNDDIRILDSFSFDNKMKLNSFCILRTINGIKYKYGKEYQLHSMIFIDGSELIVNN